MHWLIGSYVGWPRSVEINCLIDWLIHRPADRSNGSNRLEEKSNELEMSTSVSAPYMAGNRRLVGFWSAGLPHARLCLLAVPEHTRLVSLALHLSPFQPIGCSVSLNRPKTSVLMLDYTTMSEVKRHHPKHRQSPQGVQQNTNTRHTNQQLYEL